MATLYLWAPAGRAYAQALQEGERVTVRVEGRGVFRVGAARDEGARARAAKIERRIAALLDNPGAIVPVRVEPGGEGGAARVLSVSGVPVATVTPEDAADSLTSPDALASRWSRELDRALQRSKQRRRTGWGRFGSLGWDPQATATGLGLTGLGLGFALRDILSNFVSGVLLLASRPFEVGDQIIVGETEGAVVKIAMRATQIRTHDGRLVLVPNATVFTSRVTNNTAAPVRRGSVALTLGYDADLPRAVEVIRATTAATSGVLPEPVATVRVRELGASDILLEARFWTDSRRSDFVDTASAVRAALIVALKQAGIGLPDPSARVLVSREPTSTA